MGDADDVDVDVDTEEEEDMAQGEVRMADGNADEELRVGDVSAVGIT